LVSENSQSSQTGGFGLSLRRLEKYVLLVSDDEKIYRCPQNGIVLDPFLGSGTTSVTAKKLGRKYVGVEFNKEYCCWAEKRLALADSDTTIQGYSNGVFWERNTRNWQLREIRK
jgi:hypothetical protein